MHNNSHRKLQILKTLLSLSVYEMDTVPDAILVEIVSYLPRNSYLPTANISKRFRSAWFDAKKKQIVSGGQNTIGNNRELTDEAFLRKTDPLEVGNLFGTPWNHPGATPLNTSLLEYYVSCGWKKGKWIETVMRESAARGDIGGMSLLLEKCGDWGAVIRTDNTDFCSVAGAAGHMEALRFLRETKRFAWDSVEVYREASENLHTDVMDYVEANTDRDVRPIYGDGLPW